MTQYTFLLLQVTQFVAICPATPGHSHSREERREGKVLAEPVGVEWVLFVGGAPRKKEGRPACVTVAGLAHQGASHPQAP